MSPNQPETLLSLSAVRIKQECDMFDVQKLPLPKKIKTELTKQYPTLSIIPKEKRESLVMLSKYTIN